jgi:hypothetical protein
MKLSTKMDIPMKTAYRPELDVTEELSLEEASYYQALIGVLRWSVELGRIDIHTSVALLSQYLSMPRRGHLNAAYGIFTYLKKHLRSRYRLRKLLGPTFTPMRRSTFSNHSRASWKRSLD